jgi:tetratricopeptide (TPR) repeat protein
MRTPGKRVCRKATRVRIPAHPRGFAARIIAALLLILATVSASAQQRAGDDPVGAAKRHFHEGNLDAALAILDELDKAGSPRAQSLDLRGCIFMEQRKLDDALAAFRAAHATDPALFAPRLHIGDALLRQQKWEEARATYDAVLQETNILMSHEKLRFGILMTYLGAADNAGAQSAYERITFPTETPAYYYAQAAWAFAQANKREARKWMRTAADIFDDRTTAWFARPFFELGWIKTKPPLAIE